MPEPDFSQLAQIDEICERFEQEWKAGRTPDIEQFLNEPDVATWQSEQRLHLFEYLLELEIDYRLDSETPPHAEEFLYRFPDYPEVISRQFAERFAQTVIGESKLKREADRHCQFCGGKVQSAAKFCGECGRPTAGNGNPEIQQRQEIVGNSGDDGSGLLSGSEMLAHHGQFLPGALLLDRYRIVALIGKGGMGDVYRADDLKLGHPVALKFLPEGLAPHGKRHEYFLNEVRLSRQISHPNVCRVYDLSEVNDQPFLSMEYIEGEDLSRLLKRIGRLPVEKAREIARQACSGVAAAHEVGVLHRDLKPANIMIDRQGRAKVTDFGLAKIESDAREGEGIVGTPSYMAPEQVNQQPVTTQTDLYALGLILYEMFTGKRVFSVKSLEQLREVHQSSITDPSSIIPELDLPTAQIILKCLEPNPAERPASAKQIAVAITNSDSLNVAFEAGATPSPEILADLGSMQIQEQHQAAFGWNLFGGMLLGLLLCALLSTQFFQRMPLKHSPEVLAHQARELLSSAGYPHEPKSVAWGYSTDRDYLEYLTEKDRPWQTLQPHELSPSYFWYRESSRYLVPDKNDWTGDRFLSVDETRPSPNSPGMISLRLDAEGRLLKFTSSPETQLINDQENRIRKRSEPANWETLLAATSLTDNQIAKVTQSVPEHIPDLFVDERLAWTTTDLVPETEVRIEAGARNGLPVYLGIHGPWEQQNENLQNTGMVGKIPVRAWMLTFWTLSLIIGSLILARQNLRLGRAHRVGANRLSVVLFAAVMVIWLLRDTHVPSPQELDLLFAALSGALMLVAFVWVTYVAVEPHVRRMWPTTLLSWSRVITGRWVDPMVGRDLTTGVLAGVTAGIIKWSILVIPLWFGWPSSGYQNILNLRPTVSARIAVGELLASCCMALLYAFFFQLLFLLLLRFCLKNNRLVAVVFVAVMSILVAVQFEPFWLALILTGIEMSITVVLFLRFGVLAVWAAHFVRLLLKWPITLDLTQWYAGTGLFAFVSIAALGFAGVMLLRPRARQYLMRG